MADASTEPRPVTWDQVVLDGLRSRDDEVTLSYLYGYVEARAPELVARNPQHFRDKVRQRVQVLARKGKAVHVRKGVWAAKRD
jgi:hypothetical protein